MAFTRNKFWARLGCSVLAAFIAGTAFAGFRDDRAPAPAPAAAMNTNESGKTAEKSVVAAPAAPVPEKKRMWGLDATKTLHENLDAWTREAGWNPIIWDASNPYKVRLNTDSIEGEFPEVLRKISKATGLNICATRRDRYVRVTDSGVPCKLNNN